MPIRKPQHCNHGRGRFDGGLHPRAARGAGREEGLRHRLRNGKQCRWKGSLVLRPRCAFCTVRKKTSKGRELARLRESKTRPSLHEGSVGGMGRGGVNPSLEALVRGHVSAAKKQTHTHERLRHSFAHVSFTRLLFFHAAQVFHFSTQTTHSSHMSHTPFPHISEFDSLFPRGPLRRLFLSVCV